MVNRLLQQYRRHGVKLTSLLDALIARSISDVMLPSGYGSLTSGIDIDLQKLIEVAPDSMGVHASIVTRQHILPVSNLTARAHETTQILVKASSTLHDQLQGLLRYVSSMRNWHLGKIGKQRSESYEISNLMAFVPPIEKHGVHIDSVFFAQPANVTGPALTFKIVSLGGGDLHIAVTWQIGALGIEPDGEKHGMTVEEPEEVSVAQICDSLQRHLHSYLQSSS